MHTDFTKISTADVVNNGWTIADYATFRTDTSGGGIFPIERRFDAPYIWTTGYFLYGHVDVLLQAAPGAGVITSAVLMSDTADEVDWEWSGNNYAQSKPMVQTNYFGKGITGSYDRSTSVSPEFEMTSALHNYSIDWTADSLTWSIDGKAVRTLFKRECDSDQHQYPQTPSRFHLGVWLAGDESNAPGVVQWAGGLTDLTRLPYTAYVKSVNLVPTSRCAYFNYTDKTGSSDSVKCLTELPVSLSSVVSSTALNTLSAAPPAPSTTTQVIGTLAGSSSPPSSSGRGADGTNSTVSAINGSAVEAPVQLTTSTVYKTTVYETVTSCNSAVTNCPASKPLTSTILVTDVVVDYTTVCPITGRNSQSSTEKSPSTGSGSKPASTTPSPALDAHTPTSQSSSSSNASSSSKSPGEATSSGESENLHISQQLSKPASSQATTDSGQITGYQSQQGSATSGSSETASSKPPELTTSTVYSTNVYTVTYCGPEVKSCPAKSTILATESVVAYTTVCSVSRSSGGPPEAPPNKTNTPPPPASTSETQSSQTASPGNTGAPESNDSVPPPSSSVIKPFPEAGQVSSQTAPTGSPSAPPPTDGPPSPSSPTIVPSRDEPERQSENSTFLNQPSAPIPSDGASPSSSSTIIPPNEAHEAPPSLTGPRDATTLMEFGQPSASFYNTDTEMMEASASSSLSAAPPAVVPTHNSSNASPSAPNSASTGTDSSQVAAEQGSAPPPTEKGPIPGGQAPSEAPPGPDSPAPVPAAGVGDSRSSSGLAHPVPGDSSDDGSTGRSTVTRTTTFRLTSTRQSTSTVYSASEMAVTACEPGQSGADCSTVSSTTTVVASEMATPVAFTTTDVVATTEVVDVPPADSAFSSTAAQRGASGVAGTGTGTGTGQGQLPSGPKTTTMAKIAGSGRNFEVVTGLLFTLVL
ncbi:hypothetical protein diail_780, partial [Diaporthe ilicicola]